MPEVRGGSTRRRLKHGASGLARFMPGTTEVGCMAQKEIELKRGLRDVYFESTESQPRHR